MVLVKLPVPVPSVVWLSLMVGLELVLQQTPLAVTGALPSSVTLPPDVAVVIVTLLMKLVVTVGNDRVMNVLVSPYDVPALFVA